jgi:solute carrier family 13 (sodium-dependent dicarboxylate transporter), member 2/3/5
MIHVMEVFSVSFYTRKRRWQDEGGAAEFHYILSWVIEMEGSVATNAPVGAMGLLVARKNVIFWILSIIIPCLVMLIPLSETFTSQLRLFFALTSFAICLWAFETVHFLIPSLFLPVLYIIFGLAKGPQAFAAWSNHIPWMLVGAMILTNMVEQAGLLKRVSYWCILKVGGSYRGILYGLMFSGVFSAIVLPDIASRVLLFTALCYGICRSLNLEPKSKESSGIMLAGVVAALTPAYVYLTAASQTLIVYEIAGRSGITIGWMEYFIYNGIPALIWCVISVMLLDFLFKPDNKVEAKAHLEKEVATMGKLSIEEKKLIIILLVIFASVMASGVIKIDIGWIFVIGACLCYFPGINIGTPVHFQKVNYPLVIFVVSCMTIGVVSNVLGAGKYIADILYPYIAGSQVYTMASTWFLAVVLNFIMTPLAAVSSVTDPLVQIIINSDLSAVPILFAWNQGLEQIILPYEYALVLFAFGFGYISLKHLIQYFGLRMLLNIVFLLLICVPYWKLIGIS